MARVAGIDPGTFHLDVCGLDDGRMFLDRSLSTAGTLADPSLLLQLLDRAEPFDLIVGPSGYGLPLTALNRVTDDDLRLAFLAAPGEMGGLVGIRSLMRTLARSPHPIVVIPGVVHLASVPAHRKVNRVDMGTADKVCAVALGLREQAERRRCGIRDVSFILLELGGAFSAAVAVQDGRIVDGQGGTSGPLGLRAAGALDGEVAFLAGTVTKNLLFGGGVAAIAGEPAAAPESIATPTSAMGRLAWDAYVESAVKAVAALLVAVPRPFEIILSGRLARIQAVVDGMSRRLAETFSGLPPVRVLTGFARESSQAAQGAALIADGLAGGSCATLVELLGVRDASGTALDHLHVIPPSLARARLGIA
jgi:predicted butyrate kinase (DUF1464 family)